MGNDSHTLMKSALAAATAAEAKKNKFDVWVGRSQPHHARKCHCFAIIGEIIISFSYQLAQIHVISSNKVFKCLSFYSCFKVIKGISSFLKLKYLF